MATAVAKPDTTSSDYEAMSPYWEKVEAILGGEDEIRAGGQAYLPKFPNEDPDDYKYRLATGKFTNVYADIVYHLAAKPFAQEIQVDEKTAGEQIRALLANIDGKGNSLHTFAGETYFEGINRAVDWIFVEFTKPAPRADGLPLTQADEKKQGLRPYWVHIPATSMLAVYSDTIAGEEIFTHARWLERSVAREGFDEVVTERIRELNRAPILDEFNRTIGYQPATYAVWEKRASTSRTVSRRASSTNWEIVEEGKMSIGVIPLVPFITGKRIGKSWRFVPPMRDAANLQIKLYQAETRLWNISDLTAFPMLSGNGVAPEKDDDGDPKPLPVGPRAVLYAPPTMGQTSATHGSWSFIEPAAQSLTFLSGEIKEMVKELRELGRQPLTAQSGNLTVVTTTFAAQKGNTSVKAWALALKHTLERALKLTAMWLKDASEPAVIWNLEDLDLDAIEDQGPEWLKDMAKRKRLSTRTEWKEAQRRNVLSSDFNPDDEEKALEDEAQDALEYEAELFAATTPDEPTPPGGPPAKKQPAAA